MAIYTDKQLSDIHRMVGKGGSVQFEPADRICMKVKLNGQESSLYIGGIYFDDVTQSIRYAVENEDGAQLGSRKVSELSVGDMIAVVARMEEYEKYTIQRCSNYRKIEDTLNASPERSLTFEVGNEPFICSNVEGTGREYSARGIFVDPNGEYRVSFITNNGDNINQKLVTMNDRSIQNMVTCLERKKSMKKVADKGQKKDAGIKL